MNAAPSNAGPLKDLTPLASSNSRLRLVRRLARQRRDRHEERRYLIEGVGLVADALVAGVDIEFVLVADDASRVYDGQVMKLSVPAFSVSRSVFNQLASTRAPQPMMAVAKMPAPVEWEDVGVVHFAMALADVTDPGNVGTLMRAAEAAGVEVFVVSDRCADVFGPKTVRASAGSIFRLPVIVAGESPEMLTALRAAGLACVATVVDGGTPYDQVDLTGPVAVVMGNESRGLGSTLAWQRGGHGFDAAAGGPGVAQSLRSPSGELGGDDIAVTIPMADGPESLNVAMAGTLLAFEVARQRRIL